MNITLRGLASFALMLFGFALVIGGGNLGIGVHAAPQPLPGLFVSGLGLAIWVGGFRIGRAFSWARTYRWAIQTLLVLTLVLFSRNAIGINAEDSGNAPALFAGGFAVLALFCYLTLRRMAQ